MYPRFNVMPGRSREMDRIARFTEDLSVLSRGSAQERLNSLAGQLASSAGGAPNPVRRTQPMPQMQQMPQMQVPPQIMQRIMQMQRGAPRQPQMMPAQMAPTSFARNGAMLPMNHPAFAVNRPR